VDVNLELQLQLKQGVTSNSCKSSLACINFTKSQLVVETYSNQSYYIDLIAQEILITDTSFQGTEMQLDLYYLEKLPVGTRF
jgi:hypothetical protein